MANAIIAGRDPAADPDVQRIVTARALAGNVFLIEAVGGLAIEGIRSACLDHLDEILRQWRKPFAQAAADLSKAHARIGDHPLDGTASILAKGGDIADVWASATMAEQTIGQILAGWVSLMNLVRVTLNPQDRALKLAPLTLEQWREMPAKLSGWDAVRAGLDLSLPTLEEYRARVQLVERTNALPETVVDRERSAIAGREIRVPVA